MQLAADALQALIDQATIPTREQIELLHARMRFTEQLPIVPALRVAGGLRARELSIPAGMPFAIGERTCWCFDVITRGRAAVWTEHGMEIVNAPRTIATPPGIKYALFTLEDTVWTTVHAASDTPYKDA